MSDSLPLVVQTDLMKQNIDAALFTARMNYRAPVLISAYPSFESEMAELCLFKTDPDKPVALCSYMGVPVDFCSHSPHVLTDDGTMFPVEG